MSERIPPQTQEELDLEKGLEQNTEHAEAAAEAAVAQEKIESHEKAEQLKESILAEAGTAPVEQLKPEKEGTAFVAPATSGKQASFWKKAAVFAGMTLGLLGSKNADAQQKKAADKQPIKTEKPDFFRIKEDGLSDELKTEWNDYVEWIEQHGLSGDKSLDTKSVADRTLETFIAEQESQGRHMELSVNSVEQIQATLMAYKRNVEESIKNGKAQVVEIVANGASNRVTGKTTIMDSASKVDNVAGVNTTRTRFPVNYVKHTTVNKLKLQNPKGGDMEIELSKDIVTKGEGFASLK